MIVTMKCMIVRDKELSKMNDEQLPSFAVVSSVVSFLVIIIMVPIPIRQTQPAFAQDRPS